MAMQENRLLWKSMIYIPQTVTESYRPQRTIDKKRKIHKLRYVQRNSFTDYGKIKAISVSNYDNLYKINM